MTYPKPGDFLVPTSHAPDEVQDRLLLVFFAHEQQGVMAWNVAEIDADILFPVVVRQYHLEVLMENVVPHCRELLNAGPATLKPGRPRDLFLLYDSVAQEPPGSEKINAVFSYAPLTGNRQHIRFLEDLRLERCLMLRGFMGFDADPFRDQLAQGWWRMIAGDADIAFTLPPEERLAAAQLRARTN